MNLRLNSVWLKIRLFVYSGISYLCISYDCQFLFLFILDFAYTFFRVSCVLVANCCGSMPQRHVGFHVLVVNCFGSMPQRLIKNFTDTLIENSAIFGFRILLILCSRFHVYW